jgi:lipoprotein-releasing system permease protein
VRDVVALRIAMRFLSSSKAQTSLIVVGLAIGIAIQLFVGLLLQNLGAGFIATVTQNSPHVTVLPIENQTQLEGWQDMVDEVGGIRGVKAVSVAADSSALASKGSMTASILVRGLNFEDASRIYSLKGDIYEGGPPSATGDVLLGKELAEGLKVGVGDNLTIVTATRDTFDFTVSGLFDLGSAAVNARWAVVTLGASQAVFRMGGNITSIEVQVSDVLNARSIAGKVEKVLLGRPVKVENWMDNNPDVFSAVNAQQASGLMIQSFVLISLLIGIASILSITVLQKSRQIGILKAMGIRDRDASVVFLIQGFFYGVLGTALGTVIGSGLFYGFLKALEASGDSIITSTLNVPFIVGSALVVVAAATLASAFPALKSRRLSPVEVIRGG